LGSFRARVLSGLPAVDEVILGNRTVERAEKLAEDRRHCRDDRGGN
jgi:hypothetical protein